MTRPRRTAWRPSALFRQAGDRFGEALVLRNIGDALRLTGRYDEAERLFQLAIRLSRETGGGCSLGTPSIPSAS